MYKLIKYEEKYRKKLSQFIEKVFVDEFDFEDHREYISNLKFEYAKNSNESCWIVIDDNSNIIGTISCINKNEQECYLKYFYVDRQYRGKGVSKQLYKAFCDFQKVLRGYPRRRRAYAQNLSHIGRNNTSNIYPRV